MAVKIQLRRDTSSNWTSSNSLLSQGEIGIETNTLKLKIGDGTTLWNALNYYSTSGNDIRWRGTWSGANAYLINDVVYLSGTSYICTAGHTNHTPPNGSYWAILASQGIKGDTGASITSAVIVSNDIVFTKDNTTTVTLAGAKTTLTGPGGTAATISVGTVATGVAGSSATVANGGTSSAAVLNFSIPKGDKGDSGAAATVAMGSVTTLTPGSSATVTNGGTTSAAVLNFGIPQGAKGDTGDKGDTTYVGSIDGGRSDATYQVIVQGGLSNSF